MSRVIMQISKEGWESLQARVADLENKSEIASWIVEKISDHTLQQLEDYFREIARLAGGCNECNVHDVLRYEEMATFIGRYRRGEHMVRTVA